MPPKRNDLTYFMESDNLYSNKFIYPVFQKYDSFQFEFYEMLHPYTNISFCLIPATIKSLPTELVVKITSYLSTKDIVMVFLSKIFDSNIIFREYYPFFNRLFCHFFLCCETNPFIKYKIIIPVFQDTNILLCLNIKKQLYFLQYIKQEFFLSPLFIYGLKIIDFLFHKTDENLKTPLYPFYINIITDELTCPCFLSL